jgi:hypothetical protein
MGSSSSHFGGWCRQSTILNLRIKHMSNREFVEEYRSGVNQLVKNEKAKISALTQVAGEQQKFTPEIVEIIVSKILEVTYIVCIYYSTSPKLENKINLVPKLTNQSNKS